MIPYRGGNSPQTQLPFLPDRHEAEAQAILREALRRALVFEAGYAPDGRKYVWSESVKFENDGNYLWWHAGD